MINQFNIWFGLGLATILGMYMLSFDEWHTSSPEVVRDVSLQTQEDSVLAFPGAEGFGKYTTGGRGGAVLIVTNLNDEGPGSLREAIRRKEPRTIVFEVSGNIDLESPLDINYGNLTIAGQTAPGDGICLRHYPIKVKDSNVVIRYIRGRLGDEREVQDDGISVIRQKDVIIDHCSFSWGTDEVASFYDNENFTLQWCIVSESLNNSVHKKGAHGYGGIWGGRKATFHHNLLAHHQSRNPRFCGARYHKEPETEIVDFTNNVVYNWRSNSSYGGEEGNHNVVNNYYKPGPSTSSSKDERMLNPWEPFGKFYVSGNVLHGNEEITKDNHIGVEWSGEGSPLVAMPIDVVPIAVQPAEEALRHILAYAGASLKRDVVDGRVVEEVRTGTATYGRESDGIIDTQADVGGWPELRQGIPGTDGDRDGMPDSWEVKYGLDPADASDAVAMAPGPGYTNLENYLNTLVVWDDSALEYVNGNEFLNDQK